MQYYANYSEGLISRAFIPVLGSEGVRRRGPPYNLYETVNESVTVPDFKFDFWEVQPYHFVLKTFYLYLLFNLSAKSFLIEKLYY